MYIDQNSDNWNPVILNVLKIAIYYDWLVLKCIKKGFTLKGDLLKTITDYKLSTTDSPDAKTTIDNSERLRFDTLAQGKSASDRNVIKTVPKKRLLASGLDV